MEEMTEHDFGPDAQAPADKIIGDFPDKFQRVIFWFDD